MILVPRQLQRTGMTGDVPYYGGRLTPAQAYAASHPRPAPRLVPMAAPPSQAPSQSHSQPRSQPWSQPLVGQQLAALERLRDDGVITPDEYVGLRARVTR
jgi:hypothetical protein